MNKHYRFAKVLAKFLDNQYSLFGVKFGFDPLIDLIPGIGDVVGLIIAFYFVWVGWRLEIPGSDLWKMVRNILLDFLIGLTPVAGPVADVFFRANAMNFKILEKYGENIVEGVTL